MQKTVERSSAWVSAVGSKPAHTEHAARLPRLVRAGHLLNLPASLRALTPGFAAQQQHTAVHQEQPVSVAPSAQVAQTQPFAARLPWAWC